MRAKEGIAGGFGLFNQRERLELLGASLTLESASGKGSRCTILLPPTLHGQDADDRG